MVKYYKDYKGLRLSEQEAKDLGWDFYHDKDNLGCLIVDYKGDSKDVEVPQVIGDSVVTVIESYTFENKNLGTVTLPFGLVYLKEEAFYECQIDKVIIPPTVACIEDNAFGWSKKVTEIVLPKKSKFKHLLAGYKRFKLSYYKAENFYKFIRRNTKPLQVYDLNKRKVMISLISPIGVLKEGYIRLSDIKRYTKIINNSYQCDKFIAVPKGFSYGFKVISKDEGRAPILYVLMPIVAYAVKQKITSKE